MERAPRPLPPTKDRGIARADTPVGERVWIVGDEWGTSAGGRAESGLGAAAIAGGKEDSVAGNLGRGTRQRSGNDDPHSAGGFDPLRGSQAGQPVTGQPGTGGNPDRSGFPGLPSFGERSPDRSPAGAPRRPQLSDGSVPPPRPSDPGALGLVRIEAPSYAEALREIRGRYGDEVSIVHTRVIRRKGVLGVLGATGVEVYVTGRGEYEEWQRDSRPLPTPADAARTISSGFPTMPHMPPTAAGTTDRSPETPPAAAPGFDIRRVTEHREAVLPQRPQDASEQSSEDLVGALERLSRKIGDVVSEQDRAAPRGAPIGRPPAAPQRNDFQSTPPAEAEAPEGDALLEGRRSSPGGTHPVVSAAKKLLEEWGVSAAVSAELLGRLSRRSLPTLAGNLRECRELARLQLRELVRPKLPPVRPVTRPAAGTQRIISLVGPTGVGKTTTLAKLGALFRITEQLKVGFITLDTYRIGAVDQLRRYADIIQVPLEVVSPGADLSEAVERLGDVEVILIDTAGRSQKDADRIHELRAMFEGMGLVGKNEFEVHLCLALSAAPEAILAAADNFKVVGYSRILITKLDEAYRHGVLLELFQRAKAPVSYLTVGQEVPDDIHAATPERLEDLLLGES